MKILLQLEAKTISNDELANNQQDLINMLTKMYQFFCRIIGKKSCEQ